MANVKLRTIINEDNSTTFQVQFEDGKWVELDEYELWTDEYFVK